MPTTGQIYTASQANLLFGSVLEYVPIESTTLEDLIQQTEEYLMFRVINGNLIILDNKRNVLYPADTQVGEEDVFTFFSVSIIQELIGSSESSSNVEGRQDVLTITNGTRTLEVGTKCPPYCP